MNGRSPTRHGVLLPTLRHLLVFLFFNLGMSLAVLFSRPPFGLVVSLLLFWGVLHTYLLRTGWRGAPRRWATLRLRPLEGETLRWTLVAVPVVLVLSWALSELYVSLVPVPPEMFNPFGPLMRDRWGRLTVAVLAIGVAPVVEEFFFRGLIQRPLERRMGGGVGIVVAALLFALVHLLPWVLPLHFFLGLVFGWIVYVTRSIWAGVILHAANNTAAILGMSAGEDPLTRPTLWEAGPDADWWLALGVLVAASGAAVWVAGRLRRAAA